MIGPLMPIAKNEKSPPVDSTGIPLMNWQNLDSSQLDKLYYNKQGELNSALRLDHYVALDPDDAESMEFLDDLEGSGILPHTVSWSTWRGRTVRLYQMADGIQRVRPTKGMKLEVRCGAGQYVIIPPSIISDMFSYSWILPPTKTKVELLPPLALERIYKTIDTKSHQEPIERPLSDVNDLWTGVSGGSRNNTCTILAGHLLGRNVPLETVIEILLMWNERNEPPLKEKELIRTIRSINVAEVRKNLFAGGGVAQEVRDWMALCKGEFHINDLYRDLNLLTKVDRVNACQVLNRLIKEGQLTRAGKRRGFYRIMEDVLTPINYKDVDPRAYYDIDWPLGIQEFVAIFPKNIVVVAGSPNSGKTAFLLNVVRNNIKNKKCTYFSSEMAAEELRVRLEKFHMPLDAWDACNFFDRSSDFADVIDPDGLNVVDFMEISDDFPRIAKDITDIYNKLNKGVAVVGLQKKENVPLGRGAEFSLEKARLYLSLDELRGQNKHRLTIVKGKNWAQEGVNPNNKAIIFTIEDGCRFKVGDKYDTESHSTGGVEQTLFDEDLGW